MRTLTIVIAGLIIAAVAAFAAPAGRVGAVDPPTCNGLTATKWLTTKPGRLTGTKGDDVLVGSSGDDVILGGGGNDTICDGDDSINGSSGDDFIAGGWGADRVAGDAVNDYLLGDQEFQYDCAGDFGDDILLGGTGSDVLLDACGDNHADGGVDGDLVSVSGTGLGGAGDDYVGALDGYHQGCGPCVVANADGGSGNDKVEVNGGVANGGSGNDTVVAYYAGDVANGGSGSDTLIHYDYFGGAVTLNGGSGADNCDEIGGNDTLISCETVS